MVAHRGGSDPRFVSVLEARQAQQEYPAGNAPLSENKLSEILVGRDQDGALGRGSLQDLFVRCRRRVFGDVSDLVPVLPQPLDDLPLNALVAKKLQAASSGTG
jgi:hypothetical protein